MANDLRISDEEFEAYKGQIDTLTEYIEGKLTYLKEQLREVCIHGIMEGSIHENLTMFVDSLEAMEGQLTFFSEEMGNDAVTFISKVEELDYSIYEGGR